MAIFRFNPKRALALSAALLGLLGVAGTASAEGKIRLAQQFGIAYLILDVVRDQNLIEKHGKQAGLDIAVEWTQISGATAMNDALLTGNLDVVSAGVPPALVLWDRTLNRQNVKLVAALGSLPNYLITNNPAVKTLDDLSAKDRIAVPAAGVGFQSRKRPPGSAPTRMPQLTSSSASSNRNCRSSLCAPSSTIRKTTSPSRRSKRTSTPPSCKSLGC